MSINSQFFDQKQIDSGEFSDFLRCLMASAYGKGDFYNDIHIFPCDGGAFSVEWVQVPWHYNDMGCFAYVEADQRIVKDYTLPDHSYVTCSDDAEFKEYLEDWLKLNPGWVRTSFGTWTNEIENQKMQEELFQHNED